MSKSLHRKTLEDASVAIVAAGQAVEWLMGLGLTPQQLNLCLSAIMPMVCVYSDSVARPGQDRDAAVLSTISLMSATNKFIFDECARRGMSIGQMTIIESPDAEE